MSTSVWTDVYIGIGSNLNDPTQQLADAYQALGRLEKTRFMVTSRWYPSEAVGPGEQPNYINAVVQLSTRLTPESLLDALQAIEQAQGRERLVRWGARTLDLDILLFGSEIIESERLTVPHAYLVERNFVVFPLMELCPEMILPNGRLLADCAAQLSRDGLGMPQKPLLNNNVPNVE